MSDWGPHERARRPARRASIAIAIVSACLPGCSKSQGPPRYPLSGTVTYGGKPLAAGRISFEPDKARGNKGPGAYGDINAGRYETYPAMGTVGGPHTVVIEGYSGTTPRQWSRRRPLFHAFVTSTELPLEGATIDFNVPGTPSPSPIPDVPADRSAR